MTVLLKLSPEVEARVHQEAARRHLPVEEYVASVVEAAVPDQTEAERRAHAASAIQAIGEIGSDDEQRDTFDFLAKAIDEDRLSDRKLFT